MKTTITPEGPQRRTNITISPHLYAWAKGECQRRGLDFSGYLAELVYSAQQADAKAQAVSHVLPPVAKGPKSLRKKGK